MKKPYKIVSGASTPDTPDRRELADWRAKEGPADPAGRAAGEGRAGRRRGVIEAECPGLTIQTPPFGNWGMYSVW